MSIELRDVHKAFGPKKVLRGFSLRIQEGETPRYSPGIREVQYLPAHVGRVKLKLDLEACTGHGRCYELAPELFGEDEHGHAVLEREDVPAELEGRARAAEANCPERAISLERD